MEQPSRPAYGTFQEKMEQDSGRSESGRYDRTVTSLGYTPTATNHAVVPMQNQVGLVVQAGNSICKTLAQSLEYLWVSLLYLPGSFSHVLQTITQAMTWQGSAMTEGEEADLKRKVTDFRELVKGAYDSTRQDHEDLLLDLWTMAFPDTPLPSRKTGEWGKLGFQGKDPATDFRGAGIFGLTNLVYFARMHPNSFRSILCKSSYPFSIAGLSVTNLIFEMMGFGMKPTQDTRVRGKVVGLVFKDENRVSKSEGFDHTSAHVWGVKEKSANAFDLLDSDPLIAVDDIIQPTSSSPPVPVQQTITTTAGGSPIDKSVLVSFNELYAYVIFTLDKMWNDEGASYMDFPRILASTRVVVERDLSTLPFTTIVQRNREWEAQKSVAQ